MTHAQPSGGKLVLSLDFELYWGVRDQVPLASYRSNLLGVRQAIPAMLALFREFEAHATWATVGLLCFSDRAELMEGIPQRRPAYRQMVLSPYEDLSSIGENEAADPFHFGASLLSLIAATPGQEIATHTFSHFYCLEEGQTREDFEADLRAAADAAQRQGQKLRSIVFPRNQINESYLACCAGEGLVAYRGNPQSRLWHGGALSREPRWRRVGRLFDAYLPTGGQASYPEAELGDVPPFNVRASRFLRPWSRTLSPLEPLRLRRILQELEDAARNREIYHLWWHPHNFGINLEQNLALLRKILERFAELRAKEGMSSANMAEVAEQRMVHVGLTSAVGSGV